jgi:hypothetical protein
MTYVFQCDRGDSADVELQNGETNVVYKCANTRKCYWLCLRECLKKHDKCSTKCPDYLSVATVKRLVREKNR